jgi:uncharacterized protein (TIGR02145 family)
LNSFTSNSSSLESFQSSISDNSDSSISSSAVQVSLLGKGCNETGVTNWGTMQNFTSTHCYEMVNYDGTEVMFGGTAGASLLGLGVNTICLTDSRNDQDYRVRKMPDGKCWMIDNLKYAGEAGAFFKDPTEGPYAVIYNSSYCSTTGDGAHPYQAGVWPKSTTGCGYLYPWQTATQGSGDIIGDVDGDGGSAICPGWTLPIKGDYGDLDIAMINALGSGNDLAYGGGLAFQAPYSGLYEMGHFEATGYSGGCWTSTVASSTSSHCLYFQHDGHLNAVDATYYRDIYIAVRCYR